jgi:hypothetical protein
VVAQPNAVDGRVARAKQIEAQLERIDKDRVPVQRARRQKRVVQAQLHDGQTELTGERPPGVADI